MSASVATIEDAFELEWLGDWAAAAGAYRQLMSDEDHHTRCLSTIRLARCLLETCKRGETDEAEDLLADGERATSEAGDPELRGQLLLQRGRLDELMGNLKRAFARYGEAHDLLRDAGSDLTEAELVLSSADRRRGEFNNALSRLQGIQPDALPLRPRAEYFDELGAVHLARGETQIAIGILEDALALDEATATPYAGARSRLLLAEACMRTGARDRAKTLIEEAMTIYDRANAAAGLSEAYALMGKWYEFREDYVAASHYYQESFDLDRASDDRAGQVRAKRRLARTYRNRGDSNRARDLLADAKALLSPDDDFEAAAIHQEEGYLALAGSEPDYDKAINHFMHALEIAKDDGDERTIAVAKRNLARAYRENDELKRAEELLLESKGALERRGDLRELADLLDELGEVLLEFDRYEEAEAHLNKSLALDTKLGHVGSKGRTLLLLGRVATRTGARDQAGKYFRDALDLYQHARLDVGVADSLQQLGQWYLEQGQADKALERLQEGLEIDNRLNRPLSRMRAKRLLAAVYRHRGNLDRAKEYLDEADRDLSHIDDPVEQALLDLETGKLQLAGGSHRAARRALEDAHSVFESSGNPVDAATCQRYLALAAAYEGRLAEALNLLELAKATFEQRGDIPELDELYDDLGTVHLLGNRTDAAMASVEKSLEIGRRTGWRRGNGRSLVLLSKIAQKEGDFRAARTHLDDALALYAELDDEVGQIGAEIELGDWYIHPSNDSRDLSHAVTAYKNARRLARLHRDRRGAARCNRKLAHLYLEREEFQRADEALQDAETDLHGIDDTRESASLEMEFGRLASLRGDYTRAIRHLRNALEGFNSLAQDSKRREAYQLLVTSYHASGDTPEALECLREMGAERAAMYNVLVKDLHPAIAASSYASFADSNYRAAIVDAFRPLEQEFKHRTSTVSTASKSHLPVSDRIRIWAREGTDHPSFDTRRGLERFSEFCVSSFALLRNRAEHTKIELSPADAFAALSVAHWIAQTLGTVDGITSTPSERSVSG